MQKINFARGTILLVGFFLVLSLVTLVPETEANDFFEGKTITFIASSSPGGGTDALVRLISRHFSKHIPGNPKIIVKNMPGAGGLRAANYLWDRAKPDGLTMSSMNSGLIFRVATHDKGVDFKLDQFTWLGQLASEGQVIYFRSDTPYTSFEAIKKAKRKPKAGSKSKNHSASVTLKVIEEMFPGVEFNMVYAYPGTAELQLDIERGALDGRSHSIGSFLTTNKNWAENGFVKMLAVSTPKRDPRLPDVPTLAELAPKNKRNANLLDALYAIQGRWYAMPPKVPAERAKTLRDAFFAMLQDEAFVKDGERMGWNIDPLDGKDLQQKVKNLVADEDTLGVFRKILK
ncbi:MAG TPA: tripartite tricarboxylate transporter substrate-binding protein [Terriglobales bacterium]|nr:tripartite tricarboxylate transporter substrate-binding protein [Terriglobales bacterium]